MKTTDAETIAALRARVEELEQAIAATGRPVPGEAEPRSPSVDLVTGRTYFAPESTGNLP